ASSDSSGGHGGKDPGAAERGFARGAGTLILLAHLTAQGPAEVSHVLTIDDARRGSRGIKYEAHPLITAALTPDRCDIRGKLVAAAGEIWTRLDCRIPLKRVSNPRHGVCARWIALAPGQQRAGVLKTDPGNTGTHRLPGRVHVDQALGGRACRYRKVALHQLEFVRGHAAADVEF